MATNKVITGIKIDTSTDNGKVPAYNSSTGEMEMTTPSGGGGSSGGSVKLSNFVTSDYKQVFVSSAAGSLTTAAVTVNRLYYVPFCLSSDVTLTELGVQTTSSNASGYFRMGIYSTSNGRPDTLLVSSAEISTATTGYLSEGSLSLSLTGGSVYWLALCSSVAVSFRSLARDYIINLMGYLSTSSIAATHYYESLSVSWTSLPSTVGTITEGTGTAPILFSVI